MRGFTELNNKSKSFARLQKQSILNWTTVVHRVANVGVSNASGDSRPTCCFDEIKLQSTDGRSKVHD